MVNLPPVHGYGVPQILSQWQAGQNRRQQNEQFKDGLDLRTKQFKQEQEQFKEQKTQNESIRRTKIGDDAFKLLDYSAKLAENPATISLSNTLNVQAFSNLEKAYGMEFDKEAITSLAGLPTQKAEIQTQILSKIQDGLNAGREGDEASLYKVSDLITTLEANNKLPKQTIAALRAQVEVAREGIPTIAKPLSQKGKLETDVKAGIISEEKAFPGKEAVPPTPTDIDDYIARANEEAIRLTGEGLTPGEKNKAALKFKRAQAKEVSANRFALRNADAKTAELIKFNEKIGTMLAEIETAGDLLEAKGEVTPQSKIDRAKVRMSGNLATLSNHYVTLNSTGAMLNVDNETFDNIFAAARSSEIGQAFGRVTGTNEQSIRSSIKKLKPLLIQDIRQSTDMGARGLDSEKELEFYLQAATDEKTDIQSNIAAIVVLDEAFGEGKVAKQLRGLTDESLIRRISDEGNVILSGDKAEKGLPEGAKQIGTSEGKPVYQTPDGKQFIKE